MKGRKSPAVRSPAMRLVTGEVREIRTAVLSTLGPGKGWCQLGNGGSLPSAGSSGTRVALSNALS